MKKIIVPAVFFGIFVLFYHLGPAEQNPTPSKDNDFTKLLSSQKQLCDMVKRQNKRVAFSLDRILETLDQGSQLYHDFSQLKNLAEEVRRGILENEARLQKINKDQELECYQELQDIFADLEEITAIHFYTIDILRNFFEKAGQKLRSPGIIT